MAAGVNTQAIITKVRFRLGDPITLTAPAITDAELATLLTEAQRDLAWRLPYHALWFLTTAKTTSLTPATQIYKFESPASCAPDFMREVVVLYKGIRALRYELEDRYDLTSIAMKAPSETKPFYVIWDDAIEFAVGGNTTAGSFVIYYVKMPADISIGASPVEPEFPKPYFPALEEYIVMRCWEQKRSYNEYARSMQFYQDKVAAINQFFVPGRDVKKYE